MRPFFSIIIPYYNSEKTIGALLESIVASKHTPVLEVIVVDDGSSINFKFQISNFKFVEKEFKKKKNFVKFQVISLNHNKGPAAARNRGARDAKGKFLVFLDSDVTLFPDALSNLAKIYNDDPDVVAVTGVWAKHQKNTKFFPNFKALRDWSYWINERDKSGYYYLFSTRIASIKRDVFTRLGGFDEKYAGPLVEDIEFTYRVARRYAIIFAPNVRVHHEFENFWPIAMKYFWRTYYWSKLYARRKRFDPVATTSQEAITALSGAGVVAGSLIVTLSWILLLYISMSGQIIQLSNNPIIQYGLRYIGWLTVGVFICHFFLIRKFLVFVYQERGIGFAVKSFFVGLILYCFITAGAVWAKIR